MVVVLPEKSEQFLDMVVCLNSFSQIICELQCGYIPDILIRELNSMNR